MPNYLITDEVVRQLADHLTPEGAALFNASLHPTEAVPDEAVDVDMTAQAFTDAFIRPQRERARRAGLLLAALVVEPAASTTGAPTTGKPHTVMQHQDIPEGYKLLRAQLRDWADRG